MTLLPCGMLLIVVIAYTVSACTDRFVLMESSVVALLLLPLLWLWSLAKVRICDGFLAGWFLVAITLVAYLAGVQALRAGALPCGWWRFAPQCSALAGCLFVAVSGQGPRTMIRALGITAAVVLVFCVSMNAWLGFLEPFNTMCFGFGHINILANTAGPSLIAWLVLVAMDWRGGTRARLRDILLLSAGLLSLVIIAYATQRRGILLGLSLAGGWLLLNWIWRFSRRSALGLCVVMMLITAVPIWHLLSNDMPSLRYERMRQYRSGIEGVVAGLPFGFGRYGALHLQSVDAPVSRHMTADGGFGTHIHDEFLDVCLDGGPIALLLFLTLTGGIVYRLVRMRDPPIRLAYQAMAAAILAHLLTDNVYGTEVGLNWLGIVVGLMLAAPVTGTVWSPIRAMPSVRMLIGVCAVVALWGAWRDRGPASLPRQCDARAQMACAFAALDPQSLSYHAESALTAHPSLPVIEQKAIIDDEAHKMGWTIRLAGFEVAYAQAAQRPELLVADCLRIIHMNPFGKYYYGVLGQELKRHPQLRTMVASHLRFRLEYLSGDEHLPAPHLASNIHAIEDAADNYAAMIWLISNGRDWSSISPWLHDLCCKYGDVQEVAQLVFQVAICAPENSLPWLGTVNPIMEYGLRNPATACEALAQVATSAQAHAIYPLICALFPAVIARCSSGQDRCATGGFMDLDSKIVRVWALEHERESTSKVGSP